MPHLKINYSSQKISYLSFMTLEDWHHSVIPKITERHLTEWNVTKQFQMGNNILASHLQKPINEIN